MGQAGTQAVREVIDDLKANLEAACAELAARSGVEVSPIGAERIYSLHISADLMEKGPGVQYPAVYVYCDRLSNTLVEKFRSFSGAADMNIEVRVSHDHAASTQEQLDLYVEAITSRLESKRGTWRTGAFYAGGYDVQIAPVKKGGKNYLQSARVKFQLHISTV